MALLDKLRELNGRRLDLFGGEIDPGQIVIERLLSPTRVLIDGRETLLFGSNNYLGLTFEPACLEAAQRALASEGTGTTGSRMANGSYASHKALEFELARFFNRRHCLIFSTGYSANLGMISSLAGPGDVILIDAHSHASIYDGCRLSGAETIRFRHNDTADLDRRLRRLGQRARNALIVVEGLYSMLGGQPDLRRVVELKKEHGATLLVDEAHSFGVLGHEGRGMAEAAGVEEQVDFVVGTFSKSLGTTGGYCVSDHGELELARYASRPFLFTASPSPSVVASTRVALSLIRDRRDLRDRLWTNVRCLDGLLGGPPGVGTGPVMAFVLPDATDCVRAWRALLERGIYVNLVLPPASPVLEPLLRLSLSAAHAADDLNAVAYAMQAVLGDRLEASRHVPQIPPYSFPQLDASGQRSPTPTPAQSYTAPVAPE